MTLEYKENEILDLESDRKPLIGYFDKYGNIIDFSMFIGRGGHEDWENPVSKNFLKYISYFNGYTLEDLELLFKHFPYLIKRNNYSKDNRIVLHGFQNDIVNENTLEDLLYSLRESINNLSGYNKGGYSALEYDLLCFLERCYLSGDFFKSLGFEIKIHKENNLSFLKDMNYDERKEEYKQYIIYEILSYLKRICVDYLGYDSIERARLERKNPLINNLHRKSNGYEFRRNPRVISTTSTIPNERFFNYKVMDWTVDRIPRYYFNKFTHCHEIESDFFKLYSTEKEEILAMEIESLKKLPIQKRKQYLR